MDKHEPLRRPVRLAQLGARVLEALRRNPLPVRGTAGMMALALALGELHKAAKELGLLGEETKP